MRTISWKLGLLLLLLGVGLSIGLAGLVERGAPSPASAPADAPPVRLVCAAPSICEIVFALDQGDHVIGVSDYCIYPPEAQAKEKIGGWFNPSFERLVRLRPDLVMSQGKHEKLADWCAKRGVAFFTVDIESLADLYAAIRAIGVRLDVNDRADALVARIQGEMAAVRKQVADQPRRRVFLTTSRRPGSLSGLLTTGPGGFLHDLIEIAGGENVFADAKGNWPQVSKEALVVRAPEVIIEAHPDGLTDGQQEELLKDWGALPTLPAVRDGRVHFLTDEQLLVPGPRISMSARSFAKAIHPGVTNE